MGIKGGVTTQWGIKHFANKKAPAKKPCSPIHPFLHQRRRFASGAGPDLRSLCATEGKTGGDAMDSCKRIGSKGGTVPSETK